jgi:hypothetical protein
MPQTGEESAYGDMPSRADLQVSTEALEGGAGIRYIEGIHSLLSSDKDMVEWVLRGPLFSF